MQEIAKTLGYSVNKVAYWMTKHGIPRRSISEAVYVKMNPKGDPFRVRKPNSINEAMLFGMGLGLYWGEGTKASKNTVRLGNSDPALIQTFVRFLTRMCGVKKEDLRFGLQIYSDLNEEEVEKLWIERLDINPKQMYKTMVTKRRGKGSYRSKNRYGVVTVYFGNTKLRNRLVELLPR